MRLILKEDYPSLGFMGDTVSVKGGYARNFLIPRGIAVEAESSKGHQIKHVLAGINARKAKKKAEAEAFKQRLESLNLEFLLKLGEQGKSFGAVTAHDIELELQKQEVALDRKQIRLHEPIKSGGTFPVHVKLHADVTATLNIKVNVEVPAAKETGEQKEARPRRERKERKEKGEGRKASAGGESDEVGKSEGSKGKKKSEAASEEESAQE